jgi:hypothetical protein
MKECQVANFHGYHFGTNITHRNNAMIPVCDSGNEMLFMKISYLASVIFVILYQSGIHENWLPDIPSLHAICMYHMYHVFHYVNISVVIFDTDIP